jgi:hypothetical protein
MRQAIQKLRNGDVIEAVDSFKGSGYGQTPSGDDFNTGLLLGLKLRQRLEKKELSEICASVYAHSLGNNLLVNTFLNQACHGWYNENWKNLLDALSGKTGDLETAIKAILAQGETSGADTLTGFLAVWSVT